MAALSTLELMLHELQAQESLDHYGDHGKMPMLPQRPVSKARVPTNRARRAVLSFHMQEFGGKTKEEFVDGRKKRDGFEFFVGGIAFSKKNVMKNGGEEKEEKGIIGIQKCFRGYQARSHYHKLTEAVTTLQSFIRGENARKEFKISTKKLIQTRNNKEFVWKPLRDRETSIIYLQSGETIETLRANIGLLERTQLLNFLSLLVVRAWLSRRHDVMKSTKETEESLKENIETLEHVTVSQSYIRNLEQQVLRTEAALRHTERENSNLEYQIQQIHRKWELHNAKMDSKEKIWQDEFTSIQMNLESTEETEETIPNEITHFPQNPSRREEDYGETNVTIRQLLELQENDSDFHLDDTLKSRKRHKQDLRKLKGRFKSWMKEFKARLHEAKKTLDRLEDRRTERVHKTCFRS